VPIVGKSANSGANKPFFDDTGDLAPLFGSNKSRGRKFRRRQIRRFMGTDLRLLEPHGTSNNV
jgi:hypothetical protein